MATEEMETSVATEKMETSVAKEEMETSVAMEEETSVAGLDPCKQLPIVTCIVQKDVHAHSKPWNYKQVLHLTCSIICTRLQFA